MCLYVGPACTQLNADEEEEEHLEEPAGVMQSDTSLMASWILRCTFLYLVDLTTSWCNSSFFPSKSCCTSASACIDTMTVDCACIDTMTVGCGIEAKCGVWCLIDLTTSWCNSSFFPPKSCCTSASACIDTMTVGCGINTRCGVWWCKDLIIC